jgi:hypothetical protein
MPTSYVNDIQPLFRPNDIACMAPMGVRLADPDWMCDASARFAFADHGNARQVHARLAAGDMPPGGAWPAAQVGAYKRWMMDGFRR